MAATRTRSPTFLGIGAVAAYDALGYALIGPILPALRAKAHASALAGSLMFAGLSVGMLVGFIAGGFVVARRGPRGAAVGGVLLHLAADLLFITGGSSAIYTGARVVQGVGSGLIWMAAVFGVLALWPQRPEPWLGRILTAYAVGSVVGPLVAALGGTVRPFVADAALSIPALFAAVTFPSMSSRAFGWRLAVLRSRLLAFAIGMVALLAAVISVLEGSYTFRFASKLSQTGLAVLFTASTIAYGLGALLPVASRSLTKSKISAQVGAAASAVLILELVRVDSVLWWFVLIVLLGAAVGATEASVLSIASGATGDGLLTAMMVYSQAFALGFLVGPLVATWLTTQFSVVASAVAVGGALLIASASGFLVRANAAVPDRT
jgi:ACDE family multidrug resistance protein